MSVSDVVGLLGVVIAIVGAFSAWQQTQINRLKVANDEHIAARNADLAERKSYQDTIAFLQSQNDKSLTDLKEERTARIDAEKLHVELNTKHDETRRQLDGVSKDYRDLNDRFVKNETELAHVRKDLSTATGTIDSLQAALIKERSDHDDNLTRMNDENTRVKTELQKKIDALTEQVAQQGIKIEALKKQLADFGDANMLLADRVQKLQDENSDLRKENQRLSAELARVGVLVSPLDYQTEPSSKSAIVYRPNPSDDQPPTPLNIVDGETGTTLKVAA